MSPCASGSRIRRGSVLSVIPIIQPAPCSNRRPCWSWPAPRPTPWLWWTSLYADFTKKSVLPAALELGNVVVLQSLSKSAGLAALRLGFAIGRPEVVGRLSRVTGPYDINAFAVIAGKAALADRAYVEQYVQPGPRCQGVGDATAPTVGRAIFWDRAATICSSGRRKSARWSKAHCASKAFWSAICGANP